MGEIQYQAWDVVRCVESWGPDAIHGRDYVVGHVDDRNSVLDGKPYVYLQGSNIALRQSRFTPVHPSKVGQRVRVIDASGDHRVCVGDVATVIDVRYPTVGTEQRTFIAVRADDDRTEYGQFAERFIVISEPDNPPEPVEATEQPAEQGEEVRTLEGLLEALGEGWYVDHEDSYGLGHTIEIARSLNNRENRSSHNFWETNRQKCIDAAWDALHPARQRHQEDSHYGYVICHFAEDGKTRYARFVDFRLKWTEDPGEACHFLRREDASQLGLGDDYKSIRRHVPTGATMCEWGNVVDMPLTIPAALSTTGEDRTKMVSVDQCLSEIIGALNAGGIPTISHCCGHGKCRGLIALRDGRCLVVCENTEDATRISGTAQSTTEEDLQRLLDVVEPLFSPHGPVTGSLDWNMAWQHAEAVIKELRDGTERHQDGPFRWGQRVIADGSEALFCCLHPGDPSKALVSHIDSLATYWDHLDSIRPVPAPKEYTLADLPEIEGWDWRFESTGNPVFPVRVIAHTSTYSTVLQGSAEKDESDAVRDILERIGRPFAEAATTPTTKED